MQAKKVVEGDLEGLKIETVDNYTVYWYRDQLVKVEQSVTVKDSQPATLAPVLIPDKYIETFKLK